MKRHPQPSLFSRYSSFLVPVLFPERNVVVLLRAILRRGGSSFRMFELAAMVGEHPIRIRLSVIRLVMVAHRDGWPELGPAEAVGHTLPWIC